MLNQSKPVDLRVARHIESLRQLIKVLNNVANGTLTNPSIVRACSTQAELARLSIPKEKILPMSLNTLKAVAKIDPQHSWEELETLRKRITELNVSKVNRGTKSQRPPEEETLRRMLDESFRTRAFLYRAYGHLISLADSYAQSNEIFAQKLKQHRLMFRPELGLRMVKKHEGK